ncbi:MAG: imidazoleglycerol-phosphate dehydratase HisB, partial [Acidobacteria bacterium]|nr:imidazoleglycerol-phosphate dehydratase HisB [Acidobacteriota bacterium]
MSSETIRRCVSRARATRETDIRVSIDLDGSGESRVASGIGFLDHMLAQFARHGLFDLEVECRGDLEIDGHHSVEDIAITLGEAIGEAVGDKAGLARYGHAYVPMDEALARAVVDFSGRPYVVYSVLDTRDRIGELETQLVEHFWQSLGTAARVTLHVDLLRGSNQHHITEAVFKACARAFAAATRIDPRVAGVPSTKGSL